MVAVDAFDDAWNFMDGLGIGRPCILDPEKSIYNSYGRMPDSDTSIRFPLHVIVDRNGIVTYYSQQSDLALIQSAIETALASP